MPLSEFLRMAGRKIESSQQPCPADHFSGSENDLLALVWENGPVTMQGQSTRVTRSPSLTTNRVGDARNKMTGGVESVLNDMFPVVPSGDVDLSQDDETPPWLDALAQDYASVLLPEISGVVSNGMSTHNSFVSGVTNLNSGGFSPKAPSPLKARLLSSWPPPQHLQTSEALGSLVTDYIGNNTSNHSSADAVFANPPTINSSNYVNFSHFARPAILIKAEVPNSNEILISGVERVDVKEKGPDASGINPVASFGQPVDKTAKDSCPPEITENFGQETLVKNDKPLIVSNGIDSTEGVLYGEKSIDPIVATSSVGSGNSADRFSCERALNSKRKSRDTEESECRSDDVETNSVGEEKPTLGPGSGSKRSRAAEVHNLSERRRRDRINEKMRALQELIPNCNKTDKASMLDEAIEYLKTLQLQVQIMSMGAGLCMPPIMFPPGVQRMHPAHIPHFTSMGPVRMGMRFGMGMLDMNGGPPVFPVPPLQAPQFSASIPANFHTTTGPNLLVYGHPGHGLPNSIPRPSSFPLSRQPPVNSAMGLSGLSGSQNAVLPSSCSLSGQTLVNSAVGLSGLRNRSQNAVSSTLPVLNTGDITNTDKQVNCNAIGGSSINQKSDQLHATNKVLHQSATVQEDKQPTDVSGPATLTFITTTH